MGNSASSGRGHHEETVDFGYLTPHGIYTGPRDWNQATVTQLIVERKLAPFYRPLEDYEESWDDEQILAARKEPPEVDAAEASRTEPAGSSSAKGHTKRPSAAKEPARNPEAAIYLGAVECPICFLYYPQNINRSRCCDQAICTECFVQIKRVDPTTTHLVSEPAACPYCVQENFGIVYTPPSWRAGLGSEGATPPSWPDSPKATSDAAAHPSMKRRRKSFGHNDPDVVTVDHIHPDWEAKLAAVRAAVQRRANRRIIMRQVGDRLIPVGVTSGRVHALPSEEGGSESPEGSGDRGSRRARRRQQNQELNQFFGTMGLGGQDLEELMVMEAMRLSLLDHEAQQRRQQEEEAKKQREEATAARGHTTGEGSTETAAASSDAGASAPSEPAPPSELSTPAPQPEAASPPRSRTSTLSQIPPSSSSGILSPTSGPLSNEQSPGRRSGRSSPSSQYGISAAVLSATSTATAVASPSPERGSSDPLEEAPPTSDSTTENDSSPQIPSPVATDNIPAVPGPSERSVDDRSATQPPPEHPPSLTSSANPSSYDVLPSSPESSISDKPLLDAPIPSTPSAEGEPSTAAAS